MHKKLNTEIRADSEAIKKKLDKLEDSPRKSDHKKYEKTEAKIKPIAQKLSSIRKRLTA